VCDTFCVLGDGVTLFAKNSDRPVSEPQIVESFAPRRSGGRLRTQYLEIAETGSLATLLSRPTWLFGAEHGLNERRVAIGNEMIFTVDDPAGVPAALLGMDLVRLGLERGRSATGALDVVTDLLTRHGQGGTGDTNHGTAYWSSFLIADPASAWILETSGRRWAARPVQGGAAISNRVTLGRDWSRASAEVVPGADIDAWRAPDLPTGFADVRLQAGRAFVERAVSGSASSPSPACDPRAAVAALRDHGSGPWGAPGGSRADPPPPAPDQASLDGRGWSLCLHAGDTVTTASMVALLPAADDRPARAWVALGSPCLSVYVPVPAPSSFGPGRGLCVPAVVGDVEVWQRFSALREVVGSDGTALGLVRAELSVVEDRLWEEADGLGTDAELWEAFGSRATEAVGAALGRLEASGLLPPARPT
jgi:secernin